MVWLELSIAVTSWGCCHLRYNNDIVNWVVWNNNTYQKTLKGLINSLLMSLMRKMRKFHLLTCNQKEFQNRNVRQVGGYAFKFFCLFSVMKAFKIIWDEKNRYIKQQANKQKKRNGPLNSKSVFVEWKDVTVEKNWTVFIATVRVYGAQTTPLGLLEIRSSCAN